MADISNVKSGQIVKAKVTTRSRSTTLKWKHFNVAGSPFMSTMISGIKATRPYLKTTTNVLKNVKSIIQKISTIVSLIKQFEVLIKSGVYSFVNSIVALLQQYNNDMRSTGVYYLNLTRARWIPFTDEDNKHQNMYDDDLKRILAARAWFSTDEKVEVEKTIASDTSLPMLHFLNEIGYHYKKETYNEFIDSVCAKFNDINDVGSHELLNGFFSSSEGNFNLLTGMECGRPNFGAEGRIMGYLFLLPITDIYVLYDKIIKIQHAFNDGIRLTPFESGKFEEMLNDFDFDDDNKSWDTLSTAYKNRMDMMQAKALNPHFQGLTLNSLFAPIFDAIDIALQKIQSLNYTVDTSALDNIQYILKGLVGEINKLIEIVEAIDEIIQVVDALLELSNMYVVYFDTAQASTGGAAGVCELLRTIDTTTLFPASESTVLQTKIDNLTEDTNLRQTNNSNAIATNTAKRTEYAGYVSQLSILSASSQAFETFLLATSNAYIINTYNTDYATNGASATCVYTGKKYQSYIDLHNDTIFNTKVATYCNTCGYFEYESNIVGAIATDGIFTTCPECGSSVITKSPILLANEKNVLANNILDNENAHGRLYYNTSLSSSDANYTVRTGFVKLLYDVQHNRDTYNTQTNEVLSVIQESLNSIVKQHNDYIAHCDTDNTYVDVIDYESKYNSLISQISSLTSSRVSTLEEYDYAIATYTLACSETECLPTYANIDTYITQFTNKIASYLSHLTDINTEIISENAAHTSSVNAIELAIANANTSITLQQTIIDNALVAKQTINNTNNALRQQGYCASWTIELSNLVGVLAIQSGSTVYSYTFNETSLTTASGVAAFLLTYDFTDNNGNTIAYVTLNDDKASVTLTCIYAGYRQCLWNELTTGITIISEGLGATYYEIMVYAQDIIIANATEELKTLSETITSQQALLASENTRHTNVLKTKVRLQNRYKLIYTSLKDYMMPYLLLIKDNVTLLHNANATKSILAIKMENALKEARKLYLLSSINSLNENLAIAIKKSGVDLSNPAYSLATSEYDPAICKKTVDNILTKYSAILAEYEATKILLDNETASINESYKQITSMTAQLESTLGDNKYISPDTPMYFISFLFCFGYPDTSMEEVQSNFSQVSKESFSNTYADMKAWKQEYDKNTNAIQKILKGKK